MTSLLLYSQIFFIRYFEHFLYSHILQIFSAHSESLFYTHTIPISLISQLSLVCTKWNSLPPTFISHHSLIIFAAVVVVFSHFRTFWAALVSYSHRSKSTNLVNYWCIMLKSFKHDVLKITTHQHLSKWAIPRIPRRVPTVTMGIYFFVQCCISNSAHNRYSNIVLIKRSKLYT